LHAEWPLLIVLKVAAEQNAIYEVDKNKMPKEIGAFMVVNFGIQFWLAIKQEKEKAEYEFA